MILNVKIIRSDGKSFLMDGNRKGSAMWGIKEIEGISDIDFEVFSEDNATGDGDMITGSRVPSRDISIKAKVKNRAYNSANRQRAIVFFNPKYTYKLYVTVDDSEKWIDGNIVGFKALPAAKDQYLDVSFLCPDPYFKSLDEFGSNIANIIPCFSFPYISQIGKGFNVGKAQFAKEVLIENDGDVVSSCKAVLTAKGDVTNPKLVKDDLYIRVLDTMVSGDLILIDTIQKIVYKNGENIMRKIDRTSNFTDIQINVGDNHIGYDADNGTNNLDVVIYYNKNYVGV